MQLLPAAEANACLSSHGFKCPTCNCARAQELALIHVTLETDNLDKFSKYTRISHIVKSAFANGSRRCVEFPGINSHIQQGMAFSPLAEVQ